MSTPSSMVLPTAVTADGSTMDDGVDIGNRLQSGGAGAKPKKTRYARKHQVIVGSIVKHATRHSQACVHYND